MIIFTSDGPGSWWLLAAAALGGSWRLLAIPGSSWRLLAASGRDAWRLLVAPGTRGNYALTQGVSMIIGLSAKHLECTFAIGIPPNVVS